MKDQIKVRTIRNCIIPENRRAIVQDVGGNCFLVIKAEDKNGKLGSTTPFTLFLKPEDFEVIKSRKPKLKWRKLEADESFYESVDGRFEINPIYIGRVMPQGWQVVDKVKNYKRNTYFGLTYAKEIANDWNDECPKTV